MSLAQIMTSDPITVGPEDLLSTALATMDELDIRHLPVVRGERVVGVISDRDLFESTGWMWNEERGRAPVRVADIEQPEPMTVGPDESIAYLAGKLVEWGVGCAPVVAEGRLLGIVTESDVLRAYAAARDSGELPAASCPTVAERMTTEVVALDLDATAQDAQDTMRAHGIRHLPVVGGQRVLGLVTDRDLRKARGRAVPANAPVREFMSTEVQSVQPSTDLARAAGTMAELKIGGLPVVEGGALVGMLTVTDVLEHCAEVLA